MLEMNIYDMNVKKNVYYFAVCHWPSKFMGESMILIYNFACFVTINFFFKSQFQTLKNKTSEQGVPTTITYL